MKRIAYISGALFCSMTVMAILFKLLHLQGAQLLLICGLVGIAFIFIPSYATYRYHKKD